MESPHSGIEPRDEAERLLLELLDALWKRYRARVEPARRYEALAKKRGRAWRNDHVAFRTLAWQDPPAGIFSVSRAFAALGYAAAGCYEFPDKKLSAVHFQHPCPGLPKLFVSELRAWELPEPAREAVARSLDSQTPPLGDDTLAALAGLRGAPTTRPGTRAAALSTRLLETCLELLTRRPWPAPEKADVLAADAASQYAAWVLLHGYEVNHFTGASDDVERDAAALRADGVAMKDEIEGAAGSPLRQTASVASAGQVEIFEGGRAGRLDWPYAYFELAQRSGGFEGFLGPQAAGLFGMTQRRPAGRRPPPPSRRRR